MSTATEITPVHQWTNGGEEVLVLRFSDADGKAYGGFQHPLNVGEVVTAPDWSDVKDCGRGIHGWPWGIGFGYGKEPQFADVIWQVYAVKPDQIIDLGGKLKFRSGKLKYSGQWYGAMAMVVPGQVSWVGHAASGAASVTGLDGKAMAGEYGCIALAWWNPVAQRREMKCALTYGEGGLEPHVWYKLDESGNFVKAGVA